MSMEMSVAMWIGMVLWALLVVALIALAVAGTIRLVRGGAHAPRSPQELLDERYALGELDRDDYLQRRADLQERR